MVQECDCCNMGSSTANMRPHHRHALNTGAAMPLRVIWRPLTLHPRFSSSLPQVQVFLLQFCQPAMGCGWCKWWWWVMKACWLIFGEAFRGVWLAGWRGCIFSLAHLRLCDRSLCSLGIFEGTLPPHLTHSCSSFQHFHAHRRVIVSTHFTNGVIR